MEHFRVQFKVFYAPLPILNDMKSQTMTLVEQGRSVNDNKPIFICIIFI